MKINGWTKFQNTSGIERWRNDNTLKEVRVAGKTQITNPIGKYFVEIPI